ncbi:MAG TPA: nucleoside-diphosphate sugar epimerase/dehydratase, partial [Micromonosporaceae bacterium]|nr:nucleoside-diphosphate sugar epimerase/dehydratase [Micromonosporaceae bacterium]
ATVGLTAAVILAADLMVLPRPVPASAPLVGAPVALVLMLGARYVRRLLHTRPLRPDGDRAAPVLLFGAGAAAHDLLRSMLRDPQGRYLPVGLIDDDPDKRHLRVEGVRVLGGRYDVPAAAARTGARTVIFSVANADASLVRAVRDLCLRAGLDFKVLPSVGELLDQPASVRDVRDPLVTDLLGRQQVESDLDAIAGYLAGRRVLVTGAGGSIGSELCRQLQRFGPAELMMLDRDESALHAVQLSLRGTSMLDSPELILADLRDGETIRRVFDERRPHVVFHAAALKHVPLLERHPGEAVKSNVRGTLTVLQAAAGVERFVNISTDKAADPVNVLGFSKRVTERLTAHADLVYEGTFLSVRFGNVLGSRGSVLTAFTAQAAAGGPITVTHPDVTRYLMTVQEAVQLVIQAAAIGRGGEALVLDMGRPVRIADLARHIADRTPSPVGIVYTGLRPGEKLHEDLFGTGEGDVRPIHPLISHVSVPPLHPDATGRLDPYASRERVIADLVELCQADLDGPTARAVPTVPLSEVAGAGRG